MANALVQLATYELTGSYYTVTFSSIPQTYQDLVLVYSGSNVATGSNEHGVRFNGDSGSNYGQNTMNSLVGTATIATNVGASNSKIYLGGQAASVVTELVIFDYASTSRQKHFQAPSVTYTAGYNQIFNVAGTWRSTNAITSIEFSSYGSPYGYYLRQYSRVSLYGVRG